MVTRHEVLGPLATGEHGHVDARTLQPLVLFEEMWLPTLGRKGEQRFTNLDGIQTDPEAIALSVRCLELDLKRLALCPQLLNLDEHGAPEEVAAILGTEPHVRRVGLLQTSRTHGQNTPQAAGHPHAINEGGSIPITLGRAECARATSPISRLSTGR